MVFSRNGTRKTHFVILSPSPYPAKGIFRNLCNDDGLRHGFMAAMQRFRGRIYAEDGAIRPADLTSDGRHITPVDEKSWHVLSVDDSGEVCACLRYLEESKATRFDDLWVRHAAAVQSTKGSSFRKAVEQEMLRARELGLGFGEVGGWAVAKDHRWTIEPLRIILATYGLLELLGGCAGVATATFRHSSAIFAADRIDLPDSEDGALPRTTTRTTVAKWSFCALIPAFPIANTGLPFPSSSRVEGCTRDLQPAVRACVAKMPTAFNSMSMLPPPQPEPQRSKVTIYPCPATALRCRADLAVPLRGRHCPAGQSTVLSRGGGEFLMPLVSNSVLLEWADVVGSSNVITDEAPLHEAETGTFATGHRIPAIIRPGSRQEVQECLRIASRSGTPIYPISSGKNWGYGSRMPSADLCVLLDLGRMNRIVDFDEDLAYVTVEPGVSQAQLYAFLQERGSRLWMDVTGASPRMQPDRKRGRARLWPHSLWRPFCPLVRSGSGAAER